MFFFAMATHLCPYLLRNNTGQIVAEIFKYIVLFFGGRLNFYITIDLIIFRCWGVRVASIDV
jgi:hypothetical protein